MRLCTLGCKYRVENSFAGKRGVALALDDGNAIGKAYTWHSLIIFSSSMDFFLLSYFRRVLIFPGESSSHWIWHYLFKRIRVYYTHRASCPGKKENFTFLPWCVRVCYMYARALPRVIAPCDFTPPVTLIECIRLLVSMAWVREWLCMYRRTRVELFSMEIVKFCPHSSRALHT